MLRDFDDDEVMTCGWPWHGLVTNVGGAITIDLPTGSQPLQRFSMSAGAPIWLFDMGLPDIEDPAAAEVGGAWWGRAIFRGGRFWSGVRPDGSGFFETIDPVVALWWPADPEPRRPQIIGYPPLTNALQIAWRADGVSYVATRTWTAAELQQGTDQPLIAAKDSNGGWRLVGQAADYSVRWVFAGASENRMLFLVRIEAGASAPVTLPEPPGTARGGSSPGGAPDGYCGLVEVVVDKALFAPGGDINIHTSINVIENRETALGSPTYSLTDVTAPGGNSRTRTEQTEQASALLGAWYDGDGNIRTARYNRRQVATFDYLATASDQRAWDLTRSTEFELLHGGSVVAERTLSEALHIEQTGATAAAWRTISETGEADDTADWSGAYVGGSGFEPTPFPIFRAGQGLVMGVVAYILTLPGLGNVLREQDVRLMWLTLHGFNVASLCRSASRTTTLPGCDDR
ncbi:hypothetical protein ACRS3X_17070 [Ectopseudomonas hydrolytica]|uniref:hypothetical protein n=1 Tax=Ectopseudomonas hydrolytica TaxID=2493633 RepID=UPI003EE0B183